MNNTTRSYHEKLLHWIWEKQYFHFQELETIDGRHIQIHDPGSLNKTDGADFSSAEITIGKLRWFGDVELHWQRPDWSTHNHHRDPNYNNVILHVVFEDTRTNSLRYDDTPIPTLCLKQYLSKPLQFFMNRYQRQSQLPCAGQLSFISDEVFTRQLEKAHKEYFEQKVNDLLTFYDPSLPPSQAWLKLLAIGLFDGLGISHNRIPMQKLAKLLLQKISDTNSRNQLRINALKASGINTQNADNNFHWRHKGCRPGNHPRHRIQQAAELLWYMQHQPFEQWLREDPKELWHNLMNSIDTKPSMGKERGSILFGTVFLPALYLLGNLFFNNTVKSRSWALWQKHQAFIPSSLLTLFDSTDIPKSIYNKKLGAVHQLRSYCRPRNCQACKVFKSVISS